MRRDGLPYWVEPASAAAERKREKEHFLSSGDGIYSSLQADHQLAKKSSSAKCSEHTAVLAVTEK